MPSVLFMKQISLSFSRNVSFFPIVLLFLTVFFFLAYSVGFLSIAAIRFACILQLCLYCLVYLSRSEIIWLWLRLWLRENREPGKVLYLDCFQYNNNNNNNNVPNFPVVYFCVPCSLSLWPLLHFPNNFFLYLSSLLSPEFPLYTLRFGSFCDSIPHGLTLSTLISWFLQLFEGLYSYGTCPLLLVSLHSEF